jgi:hypothetical protein
MLDVTDSHCCKYLLSSEEPKDILGALGRERICFQELPQSDWLESDVDADASSREDLKILALGGL